uniref:Uncharacterized protein n=1 Tax=Acetobacter pasteurianus TaxID=438 RepID=I3W062_ACEPA|nr:hypothetical protein [Acetobacter pasteurianus]AFK88989.1 hypothetical protein [Acetobacter pasteurianus]
MNELAYAAKEAYGRIVDATIPTLMLVSVAAYYFGDLAFSDLLMAVALLGGALGWGIDAMILRPALYRL